MTMRSGGMVIGADEEGEWSSDGELKSTRKLITVFFFFFITLEPRVE